MKHAKIKALISALNRQLPWVEEFMQLVDESGVEISSQTPGRAIAQEVLADAKIHKQTTARSGIESCGFDELISAMELVPPNDQVLILGLIGSKKRGVLYCTIEERVLGGVVVARRPFLEK
ncbi:hypothetical protein [Undibacterium terreum]|uniref:Uncharacterized protein n=1 Tax=Undibacterium terreum TaxID=1224302 RepID=A0A916UTN8_9BURK|nr:hypothetical protein [Undibacterium terreum]GGC87119.1 hypothetical protein GCM10011396_38000 [Undibacterium terreum]